MQVSMRNVFGKSRLYLFDFVFFLRSSLRCIPQIHYASWYFPSEHITNGKSFPQYYFFLRWFANAKLLFQVTFDFFSSSSMLASTFYWLTAVTVVVAIFWARVLCRLVVEDARFRMRISLGVVLIRSLACTECVPGRIRSGSGVALN